MNYKSMEAAREHRNTLKEKHTAILAQLAGMKMEPNAPLEDQRRMKLAKIPYIKALSETARELRLVKEWIHKASQVQNKALVNRKEQLIIARGLLRRSLTYLQKQDVELASDITGFLIEAEYLENENTNSQDVKG